MIHIKILPSEFVRVTLSGVFACEAGEAQVHIFKYTVRCARATVMCVFSFKFISTTDESHIC